MMKKADMILIACILGVVVLGFAGLKLYRASGEDVQKIATVRYDNTIIRQINLDEVPEPDRIVITREYEQTVLIENGRIRFETSQCPDEICVKTGWLSQNGDTAVCLPNRTIIRIQGENREVDEVTY